MRTIISCTLFVFACGAQEPAPVAPGPALGGSHATAPPGIVVDTAVAPVAAPMPMRRLALAVAALADHDGHLDHAGIIRSLQELRDALAHVAPGARVPLGRISQSIEQLEISPPMANTHANHVRLALVAAVGILAEVRPLDHRDRLELREAVRVTARIVEGLEPDAPLLSQHARVVDAFEAATITLYLSVGVEAPPFEVVSQGAPPPAIAEPL